MGGHDDFMRLWLRYEADIRAFIGSLVLDRHRRDDVFQEVALALWHQFEQYDAQRSFGAWARGIAAHKILQQRDRDRRFPVTFSPETIQAVLNAYARTEADASRQVDALRHCLTRLSEKARHLLALRYGDDLAAEEIARQVGNTVEGIYQALYRIRGRLEVCIHHQLSVLDRGT